MPVAVGVKFSVFPGRASGSLMENLVECGRWLKTRLKGTVRYRKIFVFQEVDCVLYSDSWKKCRKTHLGVFVKNLWKIDENYDLIIIGGGLAGLTAEYESCLKSNNSLNIALIEQLSNIGGNSNRATSGINLLETEPQRKKNITDNFTIFYSDTMKSGKYINDPSLVSTFINGTKTLYDYYTDNFGIDITLLGRLGGHSVERTHRPTDSNNVIGSYLVKKVSEKVKTISNIKILYDSKVTHLLKNETNNIIYGLKYIKTNESIENTINCDAIILTSEGYGHDFGEDELLKEFILFQITWIIQQQMGRI